MREFRLHNGDCLKVLKTLLDASVDAVVTDPPYELGFMGKGWDASGIAYNVGLWREVLRVLKPGGHLLAFGGTRTYHRMACAIEDAGFEIRDSLHWIYGSGFPKSLDVSKAIDKAAGAEREVVGTKLGLPGYSLSDGKGGLYGEGFGANGTGIGECVVTAPATDAAKQWVGWGTALKPSHEPVIVARKPLVGTVAANVLAYGTGGLNIDGCRVQYASEADMNAARVPQPNLATARKERTGFDAVERNGDVFDPSKGRWPPNLLLSHTPECGGPEGACAMGCPIAEMDRQSGIGGTPKKYAPQNRKALDGGGLFGLGVGRGGGQIGDTGGASRFFPVFRYQAKASRSDRGADNKHPTVKPVALMRWLVRLVTPPGGVVLDPFMGSGTTGVAAREDGFAFVGIERETEYFRICEARVAGVEVEAPAQKELFG